MKQIIKWTQLVALLFGGILVSGLSLKEPFCFGFFPATLIEIPSQTLDVTVPEKVFDVTLSNLEPSDFTMESCFMDLYLTVHNPSDSEQTLDIFLLNTSVAHDGGSLETLNEADAGNPIAIDMQNAIEIFSLRLEPGDTFDGNPLDESEMPLQLATRFENFGPRLRSSEIGVTELACTNGLNHQFLFSTQVQGEQRLEISGTLVYGDNSSQYMWESSDLVQCDDPISSGGQGPSCCVDTPESSANDEVAEEEEIEEPVTDETIRDLFNGEVTVGWQ